VPLIKTWMDTELIGCGSKIRTTETENNSYQDW
jgi:hypothetical protein